MRILLALALPLALLAQGSATQQEAKAKKTSAAQRRSGKARLKKVRLSKRVAAQAPAAATRR